ncbi:IFT22 isoform 4 [Pan troglodytes]|uniref:Intraflagellar transport 22 n=3 Tax=Hominidae TaxID=9604 RepID=F8WDY0_HUMAN|nr:IFT22 isoform 4 [Pan troglodytes]PNJ85585.1 IFT22 isoform 4 [Pongo abelii]
MLKAKILFVGPCEQRPLFALIFTEWKNCFGQLSDRIF